jgi:hypothetical protein
MDGVIHEPRSFWTVQTVESKVTPQRVRTNKGHFYNGERWPITINRITFGGINYLLRAAPVGDLAVDNSGIINKIGIRVSVPQRYHLNRNMVLIGSIPAASTGQHATRPNPNYGPGMTPSSLYGQCHLNFDKPLLLPKNGKIEWDVSAHTANNAQAETAPTFIEMGYVELGGLTGSSMRSRTVQLAVYTGNDLPGIEDWPYLADALTAGGGAAAPAIGTTNWWFPGSRFPAGGNVPDWKGQRNTTFSAQEATRSGSTEIVGMRTTIAQFAYDQEVAGSFGTVPASPLSMRTGCRIRATDGGSSGHYWWRPGAPLALVFDTITPANVVRLQEPIELGPGEQLDVELEFPAFVSEEESTTYRVGVALNGYATIEG